MTAVLCAKFQNSWMTMDVMVKLNLTKFYFNDRFCYDRICYFVTGPCLHNLDDDFPMSDSGNTHAICLSCDSTAWASTIIWNGITKWSLIDYKMIPTGLLTVEILLGAAIMAGLIQDLRPANERRCYKVTLSLIGWAQTYNQPCMG